MPKKNTKTQSNTVKHSQDGNTNNHLGRSQLGVLL